MFFFDRQNNIATPETFASKFSKEEASLSMKNIRRIIATTHTDLQGDTFAVECLADVVEQARKSYIP